MIKRLSTIFGRLLKKNNPRSAISWKFKNEGRRFLTGCLPLNDHIKCDLLDACFNGTHIWLSHRLGIIYYETPKAASSTMRFLLETNNPPLWFYTPRMVQLSALAKNIPIQMNLNVFSKPGKTKTAFMNICSDIMDISKKRGNTISIEALFKKTAEELSRMSESGNKDLSYRERISPSKYGFQMFYGSPIQAAKQFDQYFKFSIVRNPYEKMVSNYFMFSKKNRVRQHQIELLFGKPAESIGFNQFVKLSKSIKNHHWEQHSQYLPVDGEKLLIDKTLHVENLSIEWQKIKNFSGIKDDIVHLNKTEHLTYKQYYDTESIRRVSNMFQDDINLLEYSY